MQRLSNRGERRGLASLAAAALACAWVSACGGGGGDSGSSTSTSQSPAASQLSAIWSAHIRHAWTRRRNRAAGGLFGATVAMLLLTGYGLYYFNGELLRGMGEWLHWTAGLLLGPLFWLHLSLGRRAAG